MMRLVNKSRQLRAKTDKYFLSVMIAVHRSQLC